MRISRLNFKKTGANIWTANSELGNFVLEQDDIGCFKIVRDKLVMSEDGVNSVVKQDVLAQAETLDKASREAQRHFAKILETVVQA